MLTAQRSPVDKCLPILLAEVVSFASAVPRQVLPSIEPVATRQTTLRIPQTGPEPEPEPNARARSTFRHSPLVRILLAELFQLHRPTDRPVSIQFESDRRAE